MGSCLDVFNPSENLPLAGVGSPLLSKTPLLSTAIGELTLISHCDSKLLLLKEVYKRASCSNSN